MLQPEKVEIWFAIARSAVMIPLVPVGGYAPMNGERWKSSSPRLKTSSTEKNSMDATKFTKEQLEFLEARTLLFLTPWAFDSEDDEQATIERFRQAKRSCTKTQLEQAYNYIIQINKLRKDP
jgi:hypothetical protein